MCHCHIAYRTGCGRCDFSRLCMSREVQAFRRLHCCEHAICDTFSYGALANMHVRVLHARLTRGSLNMLAC